MLLTVSLLILSDWCELFNDQVADPVLEKLVIGLRYVFFNFRNKYSKKHIVHLKELGNVYQNTSYVTMIKTLFEKTQCAHKLCLVVRCLQPLCTYICLQDIIYQLN